MAKKIGTRRRRIKKANHGARPGAGSRSKHIKGSGKKGS